MRKPVYAICEQKSLISAFIVRCLDSIIPLVSISEISSLYLASVAAQAGLCLAWSQTPKTGFLVTRLKSSVAILFSADIKSKKISNDQELIQSDPTSCPINQEGNN